MTQGLQTGKRFASSSTAHPGQVGLLQVEDREVILVQRLRQVTTLDFIHILSRGQSHMRDSRSVCCSICI